jgi:hypothetical protein
VHRKELLEHVLKEMEALKALEAREKRAGRGARGLDSTVIVQAKIRAIEGREAGVCSRNTTLSELFSQNVQSRFSCLC